MYKKIFDNKKAVIIDLDGTLADTKPLWQECINRVITKNKGYQITPDQINLPTLKEVWKSIQEKGFVPSEIDVEALVTQTYQEVDTALKTVKLELAEGFWDISYALREIQGKKLVLATNTEKDPAEKILWALGIVDAFDLKVFGNDVKKLKPNPEIYNKVCEILKIKAKECVVIEDSPEGATAAVKAGMTTFVVWDLHTSKDYYPDEIAAYVTSLEDIYENIDFDLEEEMAKRRKLLQEKRQTEEKINESKAV